MYLVESICFLNFVGVENTARLSSREVRLNSPNQSSKEVWGEPSLARSSSFIAIDISRSSFILIFLSIFCVRYYITLYYNIYIKEKSRYCKKIFT